MANSSSGRMAPPKPWERAGSSGSSPFRHATANRSTAAIVESSGVSDSGDKNEKPDVAALANRASAGRPISDVAALANQPPVGRSMPPRPWERNLGTGYNSMMNYNSNSSYGYGSSGLSQYGSNYGSGLYGNNMGGNGYGSPYGGGLQGGYGMGNSYGELNGNGYNRYGAMGRGSSYGMGSGGPFDPGQGDPNNPFSGGPAAPPSFWQSMLHTMHGVVSVLGRISFLVDQNTQAFHFFITALLQLCDTAGLLYGEMARFVLRLLGVGRAKPRLQTRPPPELMPARQEGPGDNYAEQPKAAGDSGWDNTWSDEVDNNMRYEGQHHE